MSRPHGSSFTAAIGMVLVLAMAAYAAAGLGSALSGGEKWAEVPSRSVELGFSAEGIIIRSETALSGGSAAEGIRIGAGDGLGDGLFSPAAGLYFSDSDGYEHLSPEDILSTDARGVAALLDSSPLEPAPGRLITGKDWYFAALLPSGISLSPGTELWADFGFGEVEAFVLSAGEGFAVLRMDTDLAEHASLRRLRGEIITTKLSGLAIAADALRSEGDEHFVWVSAAGRLEKKTVNIIFTGEDFHLAALSPEAGALREGDRVLTAGEDLYEGKILT